MKTLAILACLCVPAYAGNCNVARVVNHQQVVTSVIIPQNFVAVQYAVPVAVPSYVQYQAIPGVGAAFYGSNEVGMPQAAAKVEKEDVPMPMTLVAQRCAKCHKPNGSAWAKTELDLTGELTNEMRLHMIERILSDDPAKRMPRGTQLDSQQIGLLIQELSQVPKRSTK